MIVNKMSLVIENFKIRVGKYKRFALSFHLFIIVMDKITNDVLDKVLLYVMVTDDIVLVI